MDGHRKKPRGGKKPERPAPASTDATQQPAARRASLETTPALPDDDDNAAAAQVGVGQPDVASVHESRAAAFGGGIGTEVEEYDHDDDEEQVERFYALLANIRAMRGLVAPPHNSMVASSSSCDTDTDAAGDSTRNKRLRRSAAEPPWRPVFRMEDFEEPPPTAAASCGKLRKRTTTSAGPGDHGDSSGPARPPVTVVASSSSMPQAAVRFLQSDSRSCSRD